MLEYNATFTLVEIELLQHILKYIENRELDSVSKDHIEWLIDGKKKLYKDNIIPTQ